MFEHLAAITAGYVFAILVGYWATSSVMKTAWSAVTARLGSIATGGPTPHPEHAEAIGLMERALYAAAWQLGAKGFVGLWLVIKAAGSWKAWADDTPHGTGKIAGRTAFHLFLLGSGISLTFGVTGGLITELLDHNDWALALLLAVATLAGALGLGWFLRRSRYDAAG